MSTIDNIEKLIEHVTKYLNAKLMLFKLKAIELGTNVVSGILKILVVGAMIFSVLMFMGFGVAFWLSELFQNQFTGFFIVGILFLIITFLTILLWKSVVKPGLMRTFIQMFEDEED